MTRHLIALLAGVFTTQASAEIIVRSGEHASFSRLVFTSPSQIPYRIEQNGKSVVVAFDDQTQTFNTDGVFSLIPRTRLTEFRPLGEGRLELLLDCDCVVESFDVNSRTFALDIQNPDPNRPVPGVQNEIDEAEEIAESPGDTEAVQTDDPEPVIQAVDLPLILPNNRAAVAAFDPNQADPTTTPVAAPDATTESPVSEARTILIQEISRAASQGLLQTPLQSAPPSPVQEQETSTEVAEKSVEDALPEAPKTNLNLRAETSIDEALADIFAGQLGGRQASNCSISHSLNVAEWAPGHGYQQDLGIYRRQLFGELDRVNKTIATELSQLHIHFGFGAEAMIAARLLPNETRAKPVLTSLAEILEYGHTRSGNAFEGMQNCETEAALWAVLSEEALEPSAEINSDAIVRTFDALPKHLRGYLGPQLSERLRLAGHETTSKKVMRIVSRGERVESTSSTMEISQIDKADGLIEKSEEGLEKVIEADDQPSPEALVQLIDARVARSEAIDPSLATLAAAYAFELQGAEIGPELKRVYVLALADSGRFLTAIDELKKLPREFTAQERKATRSVVFDRLAENASDHVFLQGSLPVLDQPEFEVDAKVENAVAARLLDLGVTQLVGALISEGADGNTGRDRRLLRAKLALSEDRPQNAIAHVLGLSGKDADLIRAQALEAMGNYAQANEIFATLPEERDATQTAFLAKDWDSLQDSDNSPLSTLAQRRLAPTEVDLAEPSLRVSNQLLSDADETAARVEMLLNSFEVTTVLPEVDANE